MEYRTLGRTGVTVSRLGFGGAPAGLTNYLDRYSPADTQQREQVLAALEKALELGVTYFDTAPAYGQGAGEALFGEALAGATQPIFLATKVAPTVVDVRASVEASLTRLRRDCLDLVQIHGTTIPPAECAAILAPGGMLTQLEQLRDEGLIRFVGFSSEDNNATVYNLINCGRFDVIQIAYNLLFQHPYDFSRPCGSMMDAAAAGLGIVTMRTLTSGLLQKWVQAVNPSNTFDYAPALLQFVLSNPAVDVTLVGMRTAEEVMRNVQTVADLSARLDLTQLHAKFL